MTNKPMLSVERDSIALDALAAARQFIANGIEIGFISMPEPETPDSAHDTLPMIDRAIAELKVAQLQGEPVYQIHRFESAGWRDADKDAYESAQNLKGYTTRVLYQHSERAAQAAVVPEGYCIMPRRLTAENGAKALLLGEFQLEVTTECPECRDLEEPLEGCEFCDGEGEYGQKHTIQWDQIKFIYSEAVRSLARPNVVKS